MDRARRAGRQAERCAGRYAARIGALVLPALLSVFPAGVSAQQSTGSGSTASLPAAPVPSPTAPPSQGGSTGGGFPISLPTQNSFANPYLGSVQVEAPVPHVIPLSLDDAFRMGIANNLGLVYAKQSEGFDKAQQQQVLNVLLPNINVTGSTGVHQFDLESEGFRPSILPEFASLLGGGGSTANFPLIVKVDVTQGQATLSQYLFDWAGYDLVKALGHEVRSAGQSSASSRGQVVQNVGIAYLRVVAAQSQVAYDESLLKTDAGVLYQSQQRHLAGVGTRLDELRSRVQYGTEQQALIGDQGILAKAKIALNRSIGLAPEQEIAVSAAEPFASLDGMSAEAAVQQALAARQDYESDLEQIEAADLERKAATRERFPTLVFNGNYGVIGITGGIYHDTWTATGTLNIPIFEEAKFRSDRDQAQFTLSQARAQAGSLREQIGQQVRSDLIDLQAATSSLAVAKSNAALSQASLEQSIERFQAGIENDLPTTTAQSTLAQAQAQYVNAGFQYNEAKLNLARDLGMIDINFHPEWQGGRPAILRSGRTIPAP